MSNWLPGGQYNSCECLLRVSSSCVHIVLTPAEGNCEGCCRRVEKESEVEKEGKVVKKKVTGGKIIKNTWRWFGVVTLDFVTLGSSSSS